MIDPDCKVCLGVGWVCENRPQCGAGMPSECVALSLM
jgi:hypothetical protein